ncbi:hypothetical protein [uncultured Neptuniibacter sp.]|uniref:hypothetical protein n=1 Tax=uncultured Neptuniibacter sp. TaxID=502143 RepID=UPI0026287130|nr:hypothetical protein [uncultured Neptuniibacter sp.]
MDLAKIYKKLVSDFKNKTKDIQLNWSQLNQIRGIKLISSMYIWIFLVPIAVKLLSLADNVATLEIFKYQFAVHLSLPFSWQVFYFSALSFALATLIYQARCPRIIKEYPTYSSFEIEGKPEWHLKDYAHDIGLDYSDYRETMEYAMEDGHIEVLEGKEFTQSLFWNIHHKADKERNISFTICLSAYVIGFILIGWVVIQNFVWVINYLAE